MVSTCVSTDSGSVMVTGGCHSQDFMDTYSVHALLKADISAPPSLRHLSHAHQLVQSCSSLELGMKKVFWTKSALEGSVNGPSCHGPLLTVLMWFYCNT